MRRRVLIVVDTFALPSSYAGAVQFRDCFRDAGYDVRFVARNEPEGFETPDRIANWAWRLGLRAKSSERKAEIRRRWDDRIVELAARYDVVYALKIPSLELHQKIKALDGPRLLIQFADAFWLPFYEGLGWDELEDILKIADGITCVNELTAEYARRRNERVFIVNDGPQTEEFDKVRDLHGKDPSRITIGWIGSAMTTAGLFKIWEPLEDLFAEHSSLHLRLVGTGGPGLLNLPRFENVRYSTVPNYDQAAMIREVLAMDIGVFPLYRSVDALARGAMKATVYMSGEAAVAAQRYAENPSLIDDGVNGMLCDGDQEWHDKLSYLIRNPEERRAMAARGLATVRERFSRKHIFEQLRHAIESV